MSGSNTVKHTINLVPGTSPINVKPYRLPESQKEEQVSKLLEEGIIEESAFPWNSPILIVPKRQVKIENNNGG
jgi:hypothetical protein